MSGSLSGRDTPVGQPRLWIRPTPERTVIAAHLRAVEARFGAAGWRIQHGPAAPSPEQSTLAVLDDPWCEPTPELAMVLAAATVRFPIRWRVPRVSGLSGPQGWNPKVPPWTLWEYRRLLHRVRTVRAEPLPGPAWTGFAVASAELAASLPAAAWPPQDGETALVAGAVLFRHADPAGQERRELDGLIPEGATIVVDVGCGSGRFGQRQRRVGRTVIGIEPDPHLAAAARDALDSVIEADAERGFDALPGTVDCFIFADVLEHMVDPAAVLAAARARLTPGGTIVASVPNLAFAPVVRAAAAGRWDTTLAGVQARDHLFYTTPASFTEMAAGCGLEVVEKRPLTAPMTRSTRIWAWLTARLAGGDPATMAAPQWVFLLTSR